MSGASLASFAIRSSFVETFVELGISLPFPRSVLYFGAPFPPPGPTGGSPASQVLRDTPTPRRPSRLPSLPSVGATVPALCVRSHGHERDSRRPGLVTGCPPDFGTETTRSPRFLGDPSQRAVSRDPGGTAVFKEPSPTAMLPSAAPTASAPTTMFISELKTRPACSLSTLRSRGRPRATQDSLPAGGSPWPGGIQTRGVTP